jgi:hypothetical protein
MSGTYFNVSGIDPNENAETIFVRCRNGDPDDDILLGSGRVVGGANLLPGIQVGQFSITFRLPGGCSADNIVVSRDKSGKEILSGVTLTRYVIRAGCEPGGTITPDAPPMRAGAAVASNHSSNNGQMNMASNSRSGQ